ncbi:MAG TPA: glycosyltransferase, partial [Burkholderiales bacterium]|nr:glycosyltransferase [Burkholderiales bacterium]
MRIVICDYSGHPFQVELSRCLAARGHDVLHLHFAEFQTPKGSLAARPDDPPTFHSEGITIAEPFAKENFAKRRFQEIKVGDLAAARALAFDPDVAVGCNMPLDAQNRFHKACAREDVTFVFWLQDIYSRAISHFLAKKLGPLGGAIGHYYTALEKRLLRSSDAVVAISDGFRPTLRTWGVNEAAISVIPNWAPLSEIHPVPKDNAWARRHGLQEKTVALYSGTLGLKHDPAFLLHLARAGGPRDLQVVVVSEGPAVSWLNQQKKVEHLANLVLLPFQPMS